MRPTLFALFAFATACTAEVRTVELDDGGSTDLPSDPFVTGTEATLRAGRYESRLDGVPVNACGDLAQTVTPRTVHLDWVDADTFTWLDGTECVVFGDAYVCDLTVSRRAVSPEAELVTTTHAVGTILDATTLEEDQEVRVSCEGPGCASYGAAVGARFPCEMVVETTPVWRGQ